MNTEEIKAERLRKKRRALFRFRAVVRLVILNRHWLMELEDQQMGPNIKRNIALITRRKGKKGILSIGEKALLKKTPEDRTPAERRRLVSAISSLKCFARYPPRVRSRLARICFYMFYPAGKIIVKEGHKAEAMYFILDGEIEVTQRIYDSNRTDFLDQQIGIMEPGDMFGEVALLDKSERTATCTCSTNVELLCIYSTDFDRILRDTLQSQWDQVIMAVERFDIFKNWNKAQLRECCILAKIKEYEPLQMIYYEDEGLLNFVYFVLSGQCTIMQCLKMKTNVVNNVKKYTLSTLEMKKSPSNEIMEKINKATDEIFVQSQSQDMKASKLWKATKTGSYISEQLQEIKSIPFEILQPVEEPYKLANPEIFGDKGAESMEYHFIDVGALTCGAIFGLGEQMQHRMIMAKSSVQCLLIPRFWLLQKAQNAGNVWRRTQMYLEATIPSRDALFEEYLANRKWLKLKKGLINSLVNRKVNVNPTKVEDIPIICRIVEAID